jgi:regulator of sigma E protease
MFTGIIVLGMLVFVHELGHFVVARATGVRVLKFSLGFGPKLFGWRRGHTDYCVSAIPLGGYVKMAGEQHGEQSHEPWEYLSKPMRMRAAIVVAGPAVNYVVALIALWATFLLGFPQLLPAVGEVIAGMPAQAAGIAPGDRILTIDGTAVESWEAMTEMIFRAPGRPLAVEVQRAGSTQTLMVTPKASTVTDPFGQTKHAGLIGITPSGQIVMVRVGPAAALTRAWRQQEIWVQQTFQALGSMVLGRMSFRESMTGPIGIVVLAGEAAKMGFSAILSLASLLSLSLAIFNLFPIPIFDGGHLFFMLVEKLKGSPVSLKVIERSYQVSFVLLMALVVVVCANDMDRFGLFEKVKDWVKR